MPHSLEGVAVNPTTPTNERIRDLGDAIRDRGWTGSGSFKEELPKRIGEQYEQKPTHGPV